MCQCRLAAGVQWVGVGVWGDPWATWAAPGEVGQPLHVHDHCQSVLKEHAGYCGHQAGELETFTMLLHSAVCYTPEPSMLHQSARLP